MKFTVNTLLILLLGASLFSCGSKAESEKTSVPLADSGSVAGNVDPKAFEGEYVGDFGDGHIVIVLSYVQGKNVSGYNVHKGLRRNLKGTITEEDGSYRFQLDEPGDHQYDGKFDFTLNLVDYTGKGTWTPLHKDLVAAKSFELRQRETDSSSNQFVGFWDGPEMLEIKPDGMVILTYWEPIPGTEDESEQQTIRGQWLAQGDNITIEWPKNPYNNGEKYELTYTKGEDGYYGLVDKGNKKREFYQFGY